MSVSSHLLQLLISVCSSVAVIAPSIPVQTEPGSDTILMLGSTIFAYAVKNSQIKNCMQSGETIRLEYLLYFQSIKLKPNSCLVV